MATTYTLITSNTLSSTAASVTFSSIPNTYTDLVITMSVRSNRAVSNQDDVRFTFNSSGANYSYTALRGGNGSAISFRGSNGSNQWLGNIDAALATSNTFSNGELYIPSYNASQNKPTSAIMAMEDNSTSPYINATANLWGNTSAITSVTFTPTNGSFVSGSSFYLYGIKNS